MCFYPFEFDEVVSFKADEFDGQSLDVDRDVIVRAVCSLYDRVLA